MTSRLLALAALLALPTFAFADQGLTAVTVAKDAGGTETWSLSIQLLMLMTALTFLPAIVMMMTSFTRIIIVLAILRQAIGLQSAPSSQILVGLALFLTFFIMAPVFDRMNSEAIQPYFDGQIDLKQALEKSGQPLRQFMLAQTREPDIALFGGLSGQTFDGPEQVPMSVLLPSFVTSELKTAFQIGFMMFIPFLVIDLVVASVLMSMGMMMLSPMLVSLPFKLMLFVLVDGWPLVMSTLAASFHVGAGG